MCLWVCGSRRAAGGAAWCAGKMSGEKLAARRGGVIRTAWSTVLDVGGERCILKACPEYCCLSSQTQQHLTVLYGEVPYSLRCY